MTAREYNLKYKNMHDLHEANKILKLILEKAKEAKLKKVNKIVIGLGQIVEHGQTITAENLKFNLNLISEGSIAQGAEVVVNNSKNDHWKLVEIEGD
jgi:Zn finger protein HypA/HybF involved in hydrogenase expression